MKTAPIDDIFNLIAKYLAGETTEAEAKQVIEWKDQSTENELLFNNMAESWSIADELKGIDPHTLDESWNEVKKKIYQTATEPDRRTETKAKTSYLRIAAVILFIFTFGFLFKFLVDNFGDETIRTNGEIVEAKLPDGSEITLYTGSSIKYDKKFTKKERRVRIEGEVFFDVTPDKNKPFRVVTDDVITEVLGTSFSVSQTADKGTKVAVAEGRVKVYNRETPEDFVVLGAGERVSFDAKSNNFTPKAEVPANTFAWKTKTLRFQDTSLEEIARQLEKVYLVNVTFEDQKSLDCTVTVEFENAELNDVITVLENTLNLQVQVNDDKVIFIGSGC